MLTKLTPACECMPRIKKSINGKDASQRGAFPYGTELEFTVETPRALGASAVVLRIAEDGREDVDMPLDFCSTENGIDVYKKTVNTAQLCEGREDGLFYYEFLFLRGYETLFTDTYNNVDFELSKSSAGKFRMLVHRADYKVPDWFGNNIIYHIFAKMQIFQLVKNPKTVSTG